MLMLLVHDPHFGYQNPKWHLRRSQVEKRGKIFSREATSLVGHFRSGEGRTLREVEVLLDKP